MEKAEFARRLADLRMNKGFSARDMSLSLGQSASYINNIENCVSFPSMTVFFYICDFLDITPKEFFDMETRSPAKMNELLAAAKYLDDVQLDSLILIAKGLKKQ
ncbi:helix-turn-helix transcriptional regulator [uncultured Oscillibacter sp.]|uniref:helix-turn-helix domain-containing protein n=1 Tax=uncultured Oscillibacter sp. TaxID=876091 RepID=UPI00262CF250|nr:helix-turn-helix transcriptional regulator [uncultured Oscillibacter sp.]